MANITVSNDIDTFLQAANNAAAKSALGISELANWEENGTTLQPTVAGYDIGSNTNYVGSVNTNSITFRSSWTGSGQLSYIYNKTFVFNTDINQFNALFRKDGWVMNRGRDADAGIHWAAGINASNPSKVVSLVSEGSSILAQKGGTAPTNPQEFRIYNTYTDASNYERGFLKWDTNEFVIGTESDGTNGTNRELRLETASKNFKIGTATDTGGMMTLATSNPNLAILSFGVEGNPDYLLKVNTGGVKMGFNASNAYFGAALGHEASSVGGGHGSTAVGGLSLANHNTTQFSYGRAANHRNANDGFLRAKVQTTDDTATTFVTGEGTNYPFDIPDERAFGIEGQVIAQKSDGSVVAKWHVDATYKRDGGTLTESHADITEKTNPSGWSLAISADDTNKCIKLELTAEATVNATASFHFVEQAAANFTS